VDGASFLGLDSTFVSNVTGSVVSGTAGIVLGGSDVNKWIAVLLFAAGSGISATLGASLRLSRGSPPRHVALLLLSCEIALLGTAWIAGTTLHMPAASPPTPTSHPTAIHGQVTLMVTLLATAMGLQNGSTREPGVFTGYPPTTALTNTLTVQATSIAHCVVLWLSSIGCFLCRGRGSPAAAKEELRVELAMLLKFAPTFAAFVAGAILGAVVQFFAAWHSLAVPTACLLSLLADVAAAEGMCSMCVPR